MCKAEVMYWVLPELKKSEGDLINVSFEISGSKAFLDKSTAGFAVRVEELAVFGKSDNQLFRLSGYYAKSVADVPLKISAEYDYNRVRNWSHVPISVSATFAPSWLPQGMTIAPSIDVLIPLNDTEKRDIGVAFGLTFSRSW